MAAHSNSEPRRRGPGRPFKPGQSGNPGGTSKALLGVIAAAKAHTTLAIETLAGICRNERAPAIARVSAAGTLLDRGWGRAKQPIEADVNVHGDLIAALEAARNRVRGR